MVLKNSIRPKFVPIHIDLDSAIYSEVICIFLLMQEHACRSEGVDLARELDYKAAASWVGHPYFDVIDNSTDFETKMNRMLECVCQKLGIDTGDRLLRTSRKLKFLGMSATTKVSTQLRSADYL